MQGYQARVKVERRRVADDLRRLTEFMTKGSEDGTSLYAKLPQEEKDRLYRQQQAMQEYVRVLDERIAAFGN